jgi:hypothetical protein
MMLQTVRDADPRGVLAQGRVFPPPPAAVSPIAGLMALDVRPRGQIRWNLDGTNPREGKPYTGPIDIPSNEEVVVYAYAEDAGVTVQKNFTIRPSIGGKAAIDPEKPASVRKKITSTPRPTSLAEPWMTSSWLVFIRNADLTHLSSRITSRQPPIALGLPGSMSRGSRYSAE